MRKLAIPALLFAICACSSTGSAAGHGAIAVQVNPNPVRVQQGFKESFHFPVEVVVRETGGHPVRIARVSVRVEGPGGRNIGGGRWNAREIGKMGLPTTVPANGEVRMTLGPVRGVIDERQFSGVSAKVVVQALDETNTEAQGWTSVTVIK